MRLFEEKHAFQVSTISPALPYALFDRSISHATYEQQENGKVVFDGIIALAKANLATLEPGKQADIIVCDKNPLDDLTALRKLHMVIKSGWRIEHPVLKKMSEVERELDKFI